MRGRMNRAIACLGLLLAVPLSACGGAADPFEEPLGLGQVESLESSYSEYLALRGSMKGIEVYVERGTHDGIILGGTNRFKEASEVNSAFEANPVPFGDLAKILSLFEEEERRYAYFEMVELPLPSDWSNRFEPPSDEEALEVYSSLHLGEFSAS